jgi:hypothetical protein
VIVLSLPAVNEGSALTAACRDAASLGVDALLFAAPPVGPWQDPASAAAFAASSTDMQLGVGMSIAGRHPLEVAEEATVIHRIAGPGTWVLLTDGTASEASAVLALLRDDGPLRPAFPILSVPIWWAGSDPEDPECRRLVPVADAPADGLYGAPDELHEAATSGTSTDVWVVVPPHHHPLVELSDLVVTLRTLEVQHERWFQIAKERFDDR